MFINDIYIYISGRYFFFLIYYVLCENKNIIIVLYNMRPHTRSLLVVIHRVECTQVYNVILYSDAIL